MVKALENIINIILAFWVIKGTCKVYINVIGKIIDCILFLTCEFKYWENKKTAESVYRYSDVFTEFVKN